MVFGKFSPSSAINSGSFPDWVAELNNLSVNNIGSSTAIPSEFEMPRSEIDEIKEELAAKEVALREIQQKLSEVAEELARLHKTTADLIEAQERGRSFWRRITGK